MAPLTRYLNPVRVLGDAWDELGILKDRALDRHLRLAVTGLSRSGKTVFITSMVHHLLDGHGLPFLQTVHDGRYLTINVSPRLFQAEGFDRKLLGLLEDVGVAPGSLRVEVTEGTLLADPATVVEVLRRLHDAGVDAALDDFGTGHSSLGQVHRFPLCMMKIDRSFIAPFESGAARPRSSAVIEAVIALGRALDMEIVAEGVETEAQRSLLVSMGCVYGQGYLFGRPQPASYWLA